MRRKLSSFIATAVAGMMLAGCVTINIYFPAAAAERVADRIIEEVWQLPPAGAKSQSDKSPAAK